MYIGLNAHPSANNQNVTKIQFDSRSDPKYDQSFALFNLGLVYMYIQFDDDDDWSLLSSYP